MKIAIVHDYLHEYGGAEALVNAIWELYPNADIYSATYNPQVMKKVGAFQGAKIFHPKWKDNVPGSIRKFVHKVLIANLPMYFEGLDLKRYDLIISSSAHFAKGVITGPKQLHISYIHTPPRFLYGLMGETRKRDSVYWRIILDPLDMLLRILDYNFAQRPDYLLCNSKTVQERIKKYYHRDAKIIHPFPQVTVRNYQSLEVIPFYLIVSRLVAYKNIDLSIKVCGKHGISLKIAGDGSSKKQLEELAVQYPSVEMFGLISEGKKNELYQTCKGVICAVKDEDFGMAALEPMMYGKPVVALREAGYLETVKEDKTGVFFDDLTEEALYEAIKKLETIEFDKNYIKKHAQKFNRERFKKEFKEFVEEKLLKFKSEN